MTETDEIACHFEPSAAMIRAHGWGSRHFPIDPDAGQVERRECGSEVLVGVVAGKQQQSIHSAPANR